MNKLLIKVSRYEFWPMWLFYAPFVPYWIWNSLRSGSFSYFCKVNPGIEFGGFLDYSKYRIIEQIPKEFKPKTHYIKIKKDIVKIFPSGKEPDKAYPFVVKPDFGERGVNVELIRNDKDWENYPLEENLLIQEFIEMPFEFGIFYAKLPGKSGEVLSITGKKFLEFEADGNSTLRDFINKNSRARLRKYYLLEKFKNQLNIVHPKGTKILLEPIGNHNRGTMFYDASSLITDNLTRTLDKISQQINGFYYGRFDVKAISEEDLKIGKFIVLEVNGANSEATHIYDPDYNLLRAYKEVKRHLDIQFKISKANLKTYSSQEFYKAVLKRF